MKKNEFNQKIIEIDQEIELKRYKKQRELDCFMDIENRESNLNRARSIAIGTAFGGTTEIMMRSDGGRHIWCVMQPVEVIELIHQLAANVGCHLALKPREDFSSWRDWKVSEEEKLHYNGHPPFINDMADYQQLGANLNNFLKEAELKQKELDKIENEKKLKLKEKDLDIDPRNGSPALTLDSNGKLLNKVVKKKNGSTYMYGGAGGGSKTRINQVERIKNAKTVAAKKNINKSNSK